MDTEESKKKNNIKGAAYDCVLTCVHDREIEKTGIDQVLVPLTIVNRGNGYETRQSSLLYVFVLFFGLDPAQNTIVVYSVLRN